ncbi:MobH family relaxase [Aggregatibacter actinomycetemcomitans]|uniref:MobH family relaxase n=1 Tax=Aggregatibacter actinomycetemcomitans TaxID=714 RepID=UPI00197B7EE6|nr:MobH family relaxase [Aggregatibacter actinomycetemcomitans]MBN6079291.1 TraI domain-containing protein [Aggregatibacter actinomycetemcomitans]
MKLWLFKRKKQQDTITLINDDGWITPMTAHTLLNTPLRQKLLSILWQKVSMSQDLFDKLYRQPIERYAELVQNLPASENHHHAHLGGMLDHGLEVISFAAKLRQSYLLPPGAPPEEQSKQAEAWTAAILYGALLHDIGKIAVDLEIETKDGQPWFAWDSKNLFELGQYYRFKYIKNRDYQLHPTMGGLLAQHLLPKFALNWLAQYPDVFASLMYFVSGHYDQAGILGEIIQRADQASVANNLGGDINKLHDRPQTSLPKQILIALRHLLTQDLKLNTPGADGWLTQDALWLVSKNVTDKIRAYLMQQGISVASQNSRLFDEMQSNRLIEPTPDNRAVWRCKITTDKWAPDTEFTLLKFSPSLIWENVEQRPETFNGTVIPIISTDESETENIPVSEVPKHNDVVLETTEKPSNAELKNKNDEDEYAFTLDLLSMGQDSQSSQTDLHKVLESRSHEIIEKIDEPLEFAHHNPYKDDQTQNGNSHDFEQENITANNLISWIRNSLATNKLEINSSNAKIHIVKGKVFLASPAIFQQFVLTHLGHKDKAAWKALQKEFQRLKIHKKQPGKNGDTGLNIWTCSVAGPRKQSEIKGYLIEDTSLFFSDGKVPFDNMYLTLKEVQNEELQSSHSTE